MNLYAVVKVRFYEKKYSFHGWDICLETYDTYITYLAELMGVRGCFWKNGYLCVPMKPICTYVNLWFFKFN
jgi:hypothetical protein